MLVSMTDVTLAEFDDHAVPKIIDFGVAKATGHKLTDKTMFTQYGQLVGTLEYMSLEQAKLNQLDSGIMLMRTFMDEVFFNERGNEVKLLKWNTAKQSADLRVSKTDVAMKS
jgi:serine/threonine protein kinase